jgi:3-oxoacyl-(acyl-carrier-protein) synthase
LTDLISGVILLLEKRKAALETALKALGAIDGVTTEPATASIEKPATGRKGKKRTAAQRRKMAEGQRERWKRIRAEADKVPF